jgi:hypothetical protein
MTAKFDKVSVFELSANFQGEHELLVKAAFVSTRTGKTHGWTNGSIWSPAVRAKLKELRVLLDQELTAQHFDGAPSGAPARDDVDSGGLAEHLREPPEPPPL